MRTYDQNTRSKQDRAARRSRKIADKRRRYATRPAVRATR